MPDHILPRADCYIAAMPRSGSTMLANLLTLPPCRLALVEPWLPHGCRSPSVLEHLRGFGFDIPDSEWTDAGGPAGREGNGPRVARLLANRMAGLERWGVKEVRPALHQPSLALIRPRRVVILVRDMFSAAQSLWDKARRIPRPGQNEQSLATFILDAATCLQELARDLPTDQARVVRYEDITTDEACREDLGRWLDWPLAGNPSRDLELYGRKWEIQRHGDAISPAHCGQRIDLPTQAMDFTVAVLERAREYQTAFGYAS
ncbi:MAG: sulfotransferase family protein [Desulfocurvibacter africanus]